MTRSIFCLVPMFCLLTASLAQAGGGCSIGRQVYQSLPVYRPVQIDRTVYRPVPGPVSQPRPSVARHVMPPANVIPAKQVKRRPVSNPVLSTVERLKVAKDAFRIGHNNNALAHAGMLIKQMPNNANLLQFRSMVYFRKGDYRRAAEDAHEAVKHGAIWSTATIKDLYAYPSIYDRELKTFRRESMTNLSALFLSGYHHLVAGELEQGRDLLRRTLAIKPDHKIAAALIDLIDTRIGSSNATKLAQAN